MRGDLYHTSKKWIPNNSTRRLQSNPFGKNQNIHRLLPSVSVEWRLPLKNAYSDTIFEPIIQLSYSSDNKKNYKIPNEDSIGFELNSHNIFAKNRMPGLDLWETGGKVSYGLKLSHFFNKDGIFSGMIGQSYKFKNPDFFDKGSGLEKKLSDFLVDLSFKPNNEITFSENTFFLFS